MEYLYLILLVGFTMRLMFKEVGGIKLVIPTIIIVISSILLFEDVRIAISISAVLLIIAFIARRIVIMERAISES